MGIFSRRQGSNQKTSGYCFPVNRTQERVFDDDFVGDIFFWDIDKTYLASDFDSLRGLISVPLELAIDKRNVLGTDILLRALRRGRNVSGQLSSHPIYFVSASPPQLRTVLQRKMILDGVEYDGIAFKDQLALVRSGRFSDLRNHLGYKLTALLSYRAELPWSVDEYLFGDDAEADVLIYGLYADIVSGRLRGDKLQRTLKKHDVDLRDIDFLLALTSHFQAKDLVRCIYIHLDKQTAPEHFDRWGKRVVPCHNTFQMAIKLFEDERVQCDVLKEIADALMTGLHFGPPELATAVVDLFAREHISLHTMQMVVERLELPTDQVPLGSKLASQVKGETDDPEGESEFFTPRELLA